MATPLPGSTARETTRNSTVRLRLSKALDMMEMIKEKAGDHLEHFDRLHARHIRGFESAVKAFRRQYRRFIQPFGDDIYAMSTLPDIFWPEQSLRRFTRLWSYVKEGRAPPRLHSTCICLSHSHALDARIEVARRLYWVQLREQAGEDPYPEVQELNMERYTQAYRDIGFLRQELDEKYAWLLDFGIILTYETALVVHALSHQMEDITTWPDKVRHLRDRAVANGLVTVPIEDFTTNAMEETQGGRSTEDDVCSICCIKYGQANADNNTELAVKTECNHVFGSDCLQNWVNTGHCTCPMCRG